MSGDYPREPSPGAIQAELRCAIADGQRAAKRLWDAVGLARRHGWTCEQIAKVTGLPRWKVQKSLRDITDV